MIEKIDRDEPLKVSQGFAHFSGTCTTDGRVATPAKEPIERSTVHFCEEREPRGAHTVVQFREHVITEIFLRRRRISVHRFEIAHEVLTTVIPPIDAARFIGGWREFLDIVLKRFNRGAWHRHVARHNVE